MASDQVGIGIPVLAVKPRAAQADQGGVEHLAGDFAAEAAAGAEHLDPRSPAGAVEAERGALMPGKASPRNRDDRQHPAGHLRRPEPPNLDGRQCGWTTRSGGSGDDLREHGP
jgi:hypothetical protein